MHVKGKKGQFTSSETTSSTLPPTFFPIALQHDQIISFAFMPYGQKGRLCHAIVCESDVVAKQGHV